MKAIELRVNNWYNSTKFQTPVICEFADFAELSARADGAKVDEDLIDELFEPIPLTGGLLRRCDLKYFPFEIFGDNHRGFHIAINNDEWVFIKFIHQLQNIYFDLTNEELTIKS